MNVCILTPRFPFPENGGDVLRINNIARYLKAKGHRLILCSFFDNEVSESAKKDVEALYDDVFYVKRNKIVSYINVIKYFILQKPMQCGYYASRDFYKIFNRIKEEMDIDLYIAHLLRMTPYLEKSSIYDKAIIEMTDALSKTYNLSKNYKSFSLKKIIYKFEKKRIQNYEQKVINEFPKVVLVSQNDIDYLGGNENLAFHTNGIKCIETVTNYNKNKICFVGNMRTLQNQEAVLSFIKNIFPVIKQSCPDVQFHVVGAEPPESIQKYSDGISIFVTGFVDSVEEYIKDSCLLVAPVTIAAGIQNKVLIGMACGIPVVLTSLIAKAIPELKNKDNCFIEDDSKKFAECCINLINNEILRNKVADKGFALMKECYSWDSLLAGYEVL